jgi:DNA-binding NtrC family response regulator
MKRRILLVDDDVTVLLTLKAVLEMHDFEVHTATSASEAMKMLENGVYQMVITDVRMETPEAGLNVIDFAKKQHYDPATALLTAFPPQDGEWHTDDAASVLVKPVGTQDLVRQLEALLVSHADAKDRRQKTAIAAMNTERTTPRRALRRRVS